MWVNQRLLKNTVTVILQTKVSSDTSQFIRGKFKIVSKTSFLGWDFASNATEVHAKEFEAVLTRVNGTVDNYTDIGFWNHLTIDECKM